MSAANDLIKDVARAITDNAPAIKGFADKIGNAGKYLAVAWKEWPTILELGKLKMQEIGIQGFEVLKRVGRTLAEFIPDLFSQIGKAAATAFMNQFGSSLVANPLNNWLAKKLDWFIPGTSQELAARASTFGHDTMPAVTPKWNLFNGVFDELPNLDKQTEPVVNKLTAAMEKLNADKAAERKRDVLEDAQGRLRDSFSKAMTATEGFFGKKAKDVAVNATETTAKTKNAFRSQVVGAADYGRRLARGVGNVQEKQLKTQEETRDAVKSMAEGLKQFLQTNTGRSLAIAAFS